MNHLTLVICAYITHTHFFVNVVPNEFEGNIICNPLLQRYFVKFTSFLYQPQGCRVANTGIDMIQSCIYLDSVNRKTINWIPSYVCIHILKLPVCWHVIQITEEISLPVHHTSLGFFLSGSLKQPCRFQGGEYCLIYACSGGHWRMLEYGEFAAALGPSKAAHQ